MSGLAPDAQNRRAIDCVDAEAHWKSVEAMNALDRNTKIAAYVDHLKRFPACTFATVAQARLDQLRKQP